MKKFSYKKMVDSLTFRRVANEYLLTVHSIATHPAFPSSRYRDIFFTDLCTPVGAAGLTFVASLASSADVPPVLELYFDGKLYTWHLDRYQHIIFRIYRVVK